MSDEQAVDPWRAAADKFERLVAARLRVGFANLGPEASATAQQRIDRGEARQGFESKVVGDDVVFTWGGEVVLRIPRAELAKELGLGL